jgi:hypothetical protein
MAGRVTAFPPSGATYGGVRRGPTPRARAQRATVARRRKKSGKQYRNLVIVLVIAFIFLFTPAQEHVNKQLNRWLDELWKAIGPYHEYPVESSYTLERTVTVENYDNLEREFTYWLNIPIQRTSRGTWTSTFDRGGFQDDAYTLQTVTSMSVGASIPHISVPVVTVAYLEAQDALPLEDGRTSVHWPSLGAGNDRCEYTRCLLWQGSIPSQSFARLIISYDITSYSYTWWKSSEVDSLVNGKAVGMDVSNSGTFADLQRNGWIRSTTQLIGEEPLWYDRTYGSGNPDWAIDGTNGLVISAADNILASLPASQQDNVFAFSRAAFDYMRENVEYAQGNQFGPPRNGPTCLAQGMGDCDEQSNAWMSILRVKQVPTWYEFGALTDMEHQRWEPHAWSNILIPYSLDWCDEQGIEPETCYLEGSVDVVNNKWLLHTPTAFSEFIEPASPDGEASSEFYRIATIYANQYNLYEELQTVDGPYNSGGVYKVSFV